MGRPWATHGPPIGGPLAAHGRPIGRPWAGTVADVVQGVYHPPEAKRTMYENNPILDNDVMPGMAVLSGEIELLPRSVILTGTWTHVDSTYQDQECGVNGRFEMHSVMGMRSFFPNSVSL